MKTTKTLIFSLMRLYMCSDDLTEEDNLIGTQEKIPLYLINIQTSSNILSLSETERRSSPSK